MYNRSMNISRDPHGYRMPYGMGYPAWDPSASRAQKPPGTRRESRKGPAKDATRDPNGNRLGLLAEM